jgi:hypothetical protein
MVVLPSNFILLVCAAIVGSIVGFIIYGLIVGFENTLQEPGASDLERGSAHSENDNAARLSELEKAGVGSEARMGWKEIAERLEQLEGGQGLRFGIPATFGGGFAIIERNPDYLGEGQKKYVLKLEKDEGLAGQARPYWMSDKPKDLARWVGDRLGALEG